MPEDDRRTGTGLLARLAGLPHVRVLSQRTFGLYTLGNGVSLTGSWMQRIAMLWLVWEMTGSGFWLGMLATADMLPVLVIGPVAGAFADRIDRLTLTRYCQYGLLVVAALLAMLLIAGALSLTALLLLAAANGSLIAFSQPARMALVQNLVARRDVGTAVAISSVNVNLTRLIGPAVAGIMIVRLDVFWIFALNAMLTLVFILILHRISIAPMTPRPAVESVLAQIRGGVAFAFSDPGIRLLLVLMFFGGGGVRAVQDLFPAFAERNFAASATGLAVLTSSMAAGAIIAGLTFATGRSPMRLVVRIGITWVLGALMLSALVFSSWPLTDAMLAVAIGYCVTHSVIGTQTYVQLKTPEEMRGRTLSVHGLISRGSPALGALAVGSAFDFFGLVFPVLVASGAVIAAVALSMPAAQRLRWVRWDTGI